MQFGSLGFAVVGFVLASASSQAQCFEDRQDWVDAVGVPTLSEGFSGFSADTSFDPGPLPTRIGLLRTSNGTGFRNFVDVPPFTFPEHNGTPHASCYVNHAETGDAGTLVSIELRNSPRAFGCDVYNGLGGEGVEMLVFGTTSTTPLVICPLASDDAPQFIGFGMPAAADGSIERIVFRAVDLVSGSDGEAFGIDDIGIVTRAQCFNDRAQWVAAAGASNTPASGFENFSSFVVDTPFDQSPVALQIGEIQSFQGVVARNFIDVPPFTSNANNGTNHAACYVNHADPTTDETRVVIRLRAPSTAFGAQFFRGAGNEGVVCRYFKGGLEVASCELQPVAASQFLGVDLSRVQCPAVRTLAIDPADPGRLLVGLARGGIYRVNGGGVYRSRDGGTSWRRDGRWPQRAAVNAIAFTVEGSAVVATPDGVHRRVGRGEWQLNVHGLVNTEVWSLATHPRRADVVYAGLGVDPGSLLPGGLVSSDIRGASWTIRGEGLDGNSVITLAIHPRTPRIIYAGTFVDLHKTTDGAMSWQRASRGIEGRVSFDALAINPRDPSTVYAASPLGVSKTTNAARTWAPTGEIGTPSTGSVVSALAINARRPDTVYAALAFGGVFKTINGGASWRSASRGLPFSIGGVTALVINPRKPRKLYAALEEKGIYKSTNGSRTWKRTSNGLDPTGIDLFFRSFTALAIDRRQPRILYVAACGFGCSPVSNDGRDAGAGVFRTTNGGESWKPLNTGLTNKDVQALALSRDGKTLYAGTRGGGVFTLRVR